MIDRILLTHAIVFVLTAFAFAAGDSSAYLYLKAAQLEHEGKLDEAFSIYNQVLVKESSPTLYNKLADLERRRGNINNALSILERAEKAYPESSRIAFSLGVFYIENARMTEDSDEEKNRRLEEAKKAFEVAVALEPSEQHLAAYMHTATELQDYPAALEAFDRLINDLGKTEYYRSRGVLKLGMGNREEGMDDLEKAASIANDLQAMIRLADFAREDNDITGAIYYLMKALEESPDIAAVNLYLAELYKDQKDYDNAIRFYMQAADNTEGMTRVTLLKQVGGLALENGNYEVALDTYRAALSENRNDSQLYYLAGYAASRGEQWEEAQQIFDIGLEMFPDYAMLRKQSAMNLIMLKKPKEAVAVMDEIDVVERDLDYYLILSDAYSEISDRKKALSVIRKGLEENQNSVELYLALATQYEKEKNYDDCITVLKKALEIDPDSAPVQNFLGYLYADLNRNLNEAETLLARALAKEPDNYAYLDSKAWLLYRKGQYKEAYELILKAMEIKANDPEVLEHFEQIKKKLPTGKGK